MEACVRSAVVSGIILICLIVFITVNSFLCLNIIEDFKVLTESEAILTEKGVEDLMTHWERHETFLHLGVNSRYIDSISESIAELHAAVKTKSEEKISSSLSVLKFRLKELEKLNKLNFSNVF